MKPVAIALLACDSLFARISDLATTDDGGQLYFTSPLRVKSADENFNPKILREVGEFETYRELTFALNEPFFRTGDYKLLAPQVTGGGTIVAWTSEATGDTGVDCVSAQPLDQSNIAGLSVQFPQDFGRVRLSGDGRFALYGYSEAGEYGLLNLASGTVTSLSSLPDR